ncbi:MAG: molybdopterin-dependent oxidoreductase [Deltaproteobacteria bacterium]|nr:molybdopterin-dependent oxidoreductase [Deltaproteobacteria bacterium]MBW2691793.1 molybdopterin-dependent oxidoreductase [Deltaproteobacteria bacterium]
MEKRKTICPLDCPDACGVTATLESGKIIRLDGDADHPFTRGFLCKKVRTYHHRVQSDERVLFPQIRTGEKGDARFEQISWDGALELLASRLTEIKREHGGEALLPYSYAGNMGAVARWAGYPFFHRYGASQLMQTICSSAAKEGWAAHCGSLPGSPPEKASHADLILAWGIDIKVTNVHFWPFVTEARRRGAKLVVIDPYRNTTAKAADFYFPVRPGGDAALALSLVKRFLDQGRLDQKFIEQYTEGFDELAALLNQSSIDTLVEGTGLSLDQFDELADLIAENPKTFIRIGIGLTRNTTGGMSVRAIACLAAALGLFDGKAGRGALLMSSAFSGDSSRLEFPQLLEKRTRSINMVQLGDALTKLTPPVKALFVYSSNPLSVAPDASQVRKGLAREDLFTVVHEQFLTPTARYADLLLPATTSFENHDMYTGYGHFQMGRVEPVIPARGEALSNFDLFQRLAEKMGYDDEPFRQTIGERLDDYIGTLRGLPESVRKEGLQPGVTVTSVNLASAGDYSRFEKGRFQFAPQHVEPAVAQVLSSREFADAELRARFPLRLITPPMLGLLNSTFGERFPKEIGTVMVHPQDANARNLKAGEKVEVFNGRGRNRRTLVISEDTQPGLVVMQGIYWENDASETTGVNDLTSQQTTDLGGGGTFHESLVDVRSASDHS